MQDMSLQKKMASMDNRLDGSPNMLIPMFKTDEIFNSVQSESKLSNSSPHKSKSRNTSNKDLAFLEQKENKSQNASK